jgi:O-acetyl-ADP-ribose deacetylase (regulator of RNase III)
MKAAEKKIKTLAFSLISAGVFKGPQSLREVLRIAVMTISDYVYPELEYVVLCGYSQQESNELEFALNSLINSLKK